MLVSLTFIDADRTDWRLLALSVYGFVTLFLIWDGYSGACTRQYVLCNVLYVVTDRRAIVLRRGRNAWLAVRLYMISQQHAKTFPYEIFETRPYPTLRVGTLLHEDVLQPFGAGLVHRGWSPRMLGRLPPVCFEQTPNARELLDRIQQLAAR